MPHPPSERFPEDDSFDQRPGEAVVFHLASRGSSVPAVGPAKRKRYSQEFRTKAVALASRPDVTLAAAAAELEVSPSTLRRWLREVGDTQPERPAEAASRKQSTVATERWKLPPVSRDEMLGETGDTRGASGAEGVDDHRSVLELIEAEWPDWRSVDWPVLPAMAGPSSTPTSASVATEAEAPASPEQPAADLPERPGTPVELRREPVPTPLGDAIFPATSRLGPVHRVVVVVAALATCILLSRLVPEAYPLRTAVGALHVVSLVAAFGAVLLVDWHGLLWLAGRRGLTESTRLAAAASPVIWAGLGGLFLTGALLRPDIGSPLTLLKLALVLGVALNGAVMAPVRLRLAALSADASPVDVPEWEWRRMMVSTTVSQIGWWGAVAIGFINAA